MKWTDWSVAMAGIVTCLWPALLYGQDTASHAYNGIATTDNIWDGVYTVEQAARGQIDYHGCISCHLPDGEEFAEGAPTLTGPDFMVDWDGQTVADLVRRLHAQPDGDPGDIDPKTAAELTAFILQENGVPPGKTELSTDRAAEARILFTARKPGS